MDTSSPLASHQSPTLAMGFRYAQSRQNLTRNVAVSLPSFHACPYHKPIICGNIARTTGVSSCLLWFPTKQSPDTFDSAEVGAIAHLYRGEVYRSTIWRTRLDNTTNWSIVTMGIALSTTFSSPGASPLPLLLVGLLIAVFLGTEARRYRYFNVWRARARWLEMNFYAPIFTGEAHDESSNLLGRAIKSRHWRQSAPFSRSKTSSDELR
jgi:uncharacterized membrane protein